MRNSLRTLVLRAVDAVRNRPLPLHEVSIGVLATHEARIAWGGAGWRGTAAVTAPSAGLAVAALTAFLESHWPSADAPFAALRSRPVPWAPGEERSVTGPTGLAVEIVSPTPAPAPCALIHWARGNASALIHIDAEPGDTGWPARASRALARKPDALAAELTVTPCSPLPEELL